MQLMEILLYYQNTHKSKALEKASYPRRVGAQMRCF